jgi:hypothetical protein
MEMSASEPAAVINGRPNEIARNELGNGNAIIREPRRSDRIRALHKENWRATTPVVNANPTDDDEKTNFMTMRISPTTT